MANTIILTSVAGAVVISAIFALYCLSPAFSREKSKKKKSKEVYAKNEVFFFTNRSPQCYVTDSHSISKCELAECPKRNMRAIEKHLLSATRSLDLCLYNLTNEKLAKCIKAVMNKGVKVRVFCDGNHADSGSSQITNLRKWGAFVQAKTWDGFSPFFKVTELHMHHKFVIIDNCLLLNGSMNWTDQAVSGSFEHMVVTSEPKLVALFIEEFNQLWGDWETREYSSIRRSRGSTDDAEVVTRHDEIVQEELMKLPDWKSLPEYHHALFFTDEGVLCRPHLNSRSACKNRCPYNSYKYILDIVDSASSTIDVCLYLMTLFDVGDAIIRAHKRGVKVQYICDAGMAAWSHSQVPRIIDEGIEVRMLKHNLYMHHKWVVIDKQLVLFGSLNWTLGGLCGNWENIVITTQPDLVACYNKHYAYLWNYFLSEDCVQWGVDYKSRMQ